MSKVLWKSLLLSPVGLAATVAVSASTMAAEIQAETEVAQADALTEFSQVGAIFTAQPAVESSTPRSHTPVEETSVSLIQPSKASSNLDRADSLLAQQMPDASDTNSDSSNTLEQINRYSNSINETSSDALDQVTNVSQLRDVSPGDWAFEALRSLVERYGCIAGYPDGTYRGNRAMTRYEFAAGLNACLQQIERLITGQEEAVTREDFETLQRLVQEFEAELTTLGTRVDNLEGRVAFLEDHQFSTTTKLNGEVIFAAAGALGDETARRFPGDPATGQDIADNITFSDRVRLNFDTSFTGQDRLRIRLEAGNVPRLDAANVTNTDMARLGFDASNGNDIQINDLTYRFPLGNNIRVWIGANGFDFNDMADIHNPILESSGTGALSRFNRRNPFVFRNGGEQGLGFNLEFSDALGLDVGYFTGEGESPLAKDGIFNGDYTAIAQLNLELSETIGLGFAYGYSYYPGEDVNLSGSTGSRIARNPFDGAATSTHRFGIQGSWRLTPNINVAGWGGLLLASGESSDSNGVDREDDDATLWTWSANVSFLNLGKEGASLSIAGGMPPRAGRVDGGPDDSDTSYLVEALYKFPLNENILITPGAYVIFNPNHNDDNDTIYVGVIRTTFSF